MNYDRPEHNILQCVARRELDRAAQQKLRSLIGQTIDWEYLFSTAVKHGVASLLHKHLNTFAPDLVRRERLTETKRAAFENSQSMLYLVGKLVKVHRVFSENSIPVAIFKGPVLSQMAYGEMSLRRAGDIDALILPRDFSRAKVLLERLGFVLVPSLTPGQLRSHLNFHCEIQFMRDDWFTIVDLHWKLSPQSFYFNLDVEEVLSRLQPVDLAGTQIKTFGTEDLILYLSMHGAKHLWHRLEWISSLSEVIRAASIVDWDAVCSRAIQAHSSRMLGLGLRLTAEMFEIEIPARVFASVDPDESLLRLSRQIQANLFSLSLERLGSTDLVIHNFKVMDRKRDFLLASLRAIYTPTLSDFEAVTLPPSLNGLYYALRPLRLTKAYASLLFHKLSH